MFISDSDYRVVIGDSALKVVSQASAEVRQAAELEAIELVAGYLRPTYDTDAIFHAEGDSRNRLIVMYVADIALYNMVAALPQKMGSEVRQERYDLAVRWLEAVQAGKVIPDLPRPADVGGASSASAVIYGSQPPLRHNW